MKSVKIFSLIAFFAAVCSFRSDRFSLHITGYTPSFISDEVFIQANFSPASDGYYAVIFEVDWKDSHGNPAATSLEVDVKPGDMQDAGGTVDSRIIGGSNFTYSIIGIF